MTRPAHHLALGLAASLLLGACSDSSNNSDASLGLPEGLNLMAIDATDGAYYRYVAETGERIDLNQTATGSADSAVQKLLISDTAALGHVLHWPDFRLVDGAERLDMKYVLMRPSYTPGASVDADQFTQLAHFHGDELAAHDSDEFRDLDPGSNKAAGLARLNAEVARQAALRAELAAVLPSGQTLCRAFIDPYLQFELSHETDEEESGDAHEHGELIHYALSTNGRLHFFAEHDEALEEQQGFVALDGVAQIAQCERVTIARASEDGVLVFVPDTQRLYLVDAHGGDFHLHSSWDMDAILPAGVRADLLAVIGSGEDHDHD